MGVVYRAEHLALRRQVALKLLEPGAVPDAGGVELAARFEREARAVARLDHPGCVRVLDHGRTVDRQMYLAMELLDGATLAATLRDEGTLSETRAVRIARELLRALAHAHRAGVLHRDVKPANVMWTTRDGAPRLVLIDFGLARLADDALITGAGICMGSPGYLAPERLLGRSYDARADLYAIGVMLYEMLAGARPFLGFDDREIIRGHLERPPRPLRAIRPDVSAALDAVIVRALAKDPARRFADAEDMLAALDALPARRAVEYAVKLTMRAEEDTTCAIVELAAPRPSLARRAWSWLRYGAWRWSSPSGSVSVG
jgi:serine/threonine-protein kinase